MNIRQKIANLSAANAAQFLERLNNKLFGSWFSLVEIYRIAEFTIQYVEIAVKPRFGNTILYIFIYAIFGGIEFCGYYSVSDVFQRQYLSA